MRADPILAPRQRQLSDFVAERMGLHFPPERWADLQRGLTGAAAEYGFADLHSCVDWLLTAPLTGADFQTLAGHLTIGETYFFREQATFEALEKHVLPALIQSRRGREQRLRLWSAGCCTGEEAYSLAILLRRLLPDLADWQVTILATDINPHFLRLAVAGTYGEWSFRAAPAGFKERYFQRTAAGRHAIAPRLAAMVTFEHLNLVADGYPSLATDTNAMDLIFCRNVLMYFTPAQVRNVIGKMHRALLAGGWLAVAPCEASQDLFPPFATRHFPNAILFQKCEPAAPGAASTTANPFPTAAAQSAPLLSGWRPVSPAPLAAARPVPGTSYGIAVALFQQGRDEAAAEALLAAGEGPGTSPAACSLLARARANQGRLAEALGWCDRWIAADPTDPAGHYLRGVVLLEHGDREESRRALQRAVTLQPDFVIAHFTLGSLARSRGRSDEADGHFARARALLTRQPRDATLPESDGLTVGRLLETLTALTVPPAAPASLSFLAR